jgi:hypothetical protein
MIYYVLCVQLILATVSGTGGYVALSGMMIDER